MGILKCLIRYNQQTDDHLGKKNRKQKLPKYFLTSTINSSKITKIHMEINTVFDRGNCYCRDSNL